MERSMGSEGNSKVIGTRCVSERREESGEERGEEWLSSYKLMCLWDGKEADRQRRPKRRQPTVRPDLQLAKHFFYALL